MELCPACHNPLEECDCFVNEGFEPPMVPELKKKREYGLPQGPLPGIKTHGSSGYAKGCRCEVCREVKANWAKEYRKDYKARMDME